MSELGEMLRQARHSKNLTIEEAATATRIKETYLSALEDGDYSVLPGPAYVTGFLRNYARFLDLHPDDVVQEFHWERPPAQPAVKAATRVLANGQNRETRTRILWTFGIVALILAAAYAVKQYNDASAHAYMAPVNVTAGLTGTLSPTPPTKAKTVKTIHVHLQALAPVWVRVRVDGHRVFQGNLNPGARQTDWTGHHAIYVMTFDGAHLRAVYNGQRLGVLAHKPGVMVDMATARSWLKVM